MSIKKYKKHILLFLLLICLGLIIYFNRNIDIYLLPPSYYSNDIYGDDFINILKNYGNVINTSYPNDIFDIDKFTDSISNKINNSYNKSILVGWSIGTLISNIIASKCNNLIGMLFISYSCNGQVTEKAKDIGIKISKTQDIQNKIKYMNELMFPPNYKLSNYISNQLKINILSNKNQNNIGISIGKWIEKNPKGICINKYPIYVLLGDRDIVYQNPVNICNFAVCTRIKEAGHGILLSHHKETLEWLNNSLIKLINR